MTFTRTAAAGEAPTAASAPLATEPVTMPATSTRSALTTTLPSARTTVSAERRSRQRELLG